MAPKKMLSLCLYFHLTLLGLCNPMKGNEMSEEMESALPPKKKMGIGKKIGIGFVGFIVFCFILGFIGGGSSSDTSSTASSEPTAAASSEPTVDEAPWFPAGYSEVQDGIALKWMTVAEDNASDACTGDHCWGAYVIARDGCPSSLYAEITLLDGQDVQLGYTNDSVGSVSPGTKVRLMFNTYENSARQARLAKVSCY